MLNLREISFSLLHDNFVSESFRFDILKVIYNENEIYDYLFNIINSYYLLWENNNRHNFYISSVFYFLEEVKYYFKNKSFSFENEIRIIARKINLCCSDKFEEENKADCVNEENHKKSFLSLNV